MGMMAARRPLASLTIDSPPCKTPPPLPPTSLRLGPYARIEDLSHQHHISMGHILLPIPYVIAPQRE